MEIMLEIISRQKFTSDITPSHVFSEVGGYIGRAKTCEWYLTDKTKFISRKHALISCDGRHFYIEDVSSNGITSPLTKAPLEKGKRHTIEHGASFILGSYTIQARLLHNPETYLQNQPEELSDSIIPSDAALDLDPLVAMEQQESFVAKQRLGLYNDLLGDISKSAPQPRDHNEPRLDSLQNITAIPENWDGLPIQQPKISTAHTLQEAAHPQLTPQLTPETAQQPKSSSPVNMMHPLAHTHPHILNATPLAVAPESAPLTESQPEVDIFFKALGFTSSPETQKERERILLQSAELLKAFTEGMIEAMHNRAETKNELRLPVTTVRMNSHNPIKFSPTVAAAFELLLGPEQQNILEGQHAVAECWKDIHAHNLGLLAGARAAVLGVLNAISPHIIESKVDANGSIRLRRNAHLWHTFIRTHQTMLNDSDGFAAFFLNDFSRAYTMQQHTLHPYAKVKKGEI